MNNTRLSYRLILANSADRGTKDVGENVFLNNLASDYELYLFYYPGELSNKDLENKLRSLGNDAGKNLLVNIGRVNDPHFPKIARTFGIRDFPVVVVTAREQLASLDTGSNFSTAYVRIDNKNLLGSVEPMIESIQRVFVLFLAGKISDALRRARDDQRRAVASHVKGTVISVLGGIRGFLSDKDITVSLFEGKFEVRRNTASASG